MNLRQAAQQALEALIPLANAASPNERECLTDEDHERAAEAVEALCAALAEPEQEPVGINGLTEAETDASASVTGLMGKPEHEPVAWMADDGTLLSDVTNPKMYTPLYTAPTPRKPVELTDWDIDRVTDQQWAQHNHKPIYAAHRAYARAVIAAYEAKQGEQHE